MDDGWSPKLVSLVLKQTFGHDESMQVSHETIYQSLYVQGRGELRKDLYRCLSTSRSKRMPHGERPRELQGSTTRTLRRSQNAPPKPLTVPFRALGRRSHHRQRRPQRHRHLGRARHPIHGAAAPARPATAQEVADAMITQMRRLPDQLVKTVTWDRGSEMVQHPASRWLWTRESTSATRTRHGSAEPTRTPTGCCGTGLRRAQTSQPSPPRTSRQSPTSSTTGPAPR